MKRMVVRLKGGKDPKGDCCDGHVTDTHCKRINVPSKLGMAREGHFELMLWERHGLPLQCIRIPLGPEPGKREVSVLA